MAELSSRPTRSWRGDLLELGRHARRLLPHSTDWLQARPRRDLTAGLMVGLVALPLALGFGVSSGMGATAGLITAIVAGAVAAIFGGSRVQVSGPTGAMTVVLVPIFATYGADGVLVVGLLAGLILIGLALGGAGRFIRYVPVPVVEGFTLGIAGIIALQQLPAALGVEVHAEKVLALAAAAVRAWVESPAWVPVGMAAGVIIAILAITRIRPALPGSLIAVAVATAANSGLGLGADTIARWSRWAIWTLWSSRRSRSRHWRHWRVCCRPPLLTR